MSKRRDPAVNRDRSGGRRENDRVAGAVIFVAMMLLQKRSNSRMIFSRVIVLAVVCGCSQWTAN